MQLWKVFDVRSNGVEAVIYTSGVGTGMQRLMQEHDRMFPNPEAHIDIRQWNKQSHDRWLIIDDRLYHCGHSLNANGGHKMSAITLMGTSPEVIRVTSKTNGNSIFLPAAGFRGGSLINVGSCGYYWSAGSYSNMNGSGLYFFSSYVFPQSNSSRANGYSVRPVSE